MNEREIFVRAMRAAPAERAALMDDLCGSAGQLRQRIEVLLEAQSQLGDFLETPACGDRSRVDPPIPTRLGQSLGAYRLLKMLGDGGMGTVYLAEQQTPFSRQVAVKIVKQGHSSQELAARFELERQALALMDHPNIARVLEGGTTHDGHPYFVMELIDGRPITDYCTFHQLDPHQRLQLLEDVCRGVQHSHQKGWDPLESTCRHASLSIL